MMPPFPNDGSRASDEGSLPILLRLYIAGGTLASTRAQANLDAYCQQQEPGRFNVEVVDILCEPLRALSDGILVTPTLVRLSPSPTIKVVGDLSDRVAVYSALGLSHRISK